VSCVTSHCLALAPQSSAKKNNFDITVYCISFIANCEAQRVSINLKTLWKIGLDAKINTAAKMLNNQCQRKLFLSLSLW
jgi:hypothetical protein